MDGPGRLSHANTDPGAAGDIRRTRAELIDALSDPDPPPGCGHRFQSEQRGGEGNS
jgi:hypothetical protein